MGLLGTLLLIFLIVHISKFWVVSRFTGIPTLDANGHEDMFVIMVETFKNPLIVLLYVLAMMSLAYHLFMDLLLLSRHWAGITKNIHRSLKRWAFGIPFSSL